jgi:hypothetical protein
MEGAQVPGDGRQAQMETSCDIKPVSHSTLPCPQQTSPINRVDPTGSLIIHHHPPLLHRTF